MRKLVAFAVVALAVFLLFALRERGERAGAEPSVSDERVRTDFAPLPHDDTTQHADSRPAAATRATAAAEASTAEARATLVVRTLGPRWQPLQASRVELRAADDDRTLPVDARDTDSVGAAEFDVPARVELICVARAAAPETNPVEREIEPLAAGETRELVVVLGARSRVTVRAVDQYSAPAAQLVLVLTPTIGESAALAHGDEPVLLADTRSIPEHHTCFTDALGTCTFYDVPAGEWWVVTRRTRMPWDPIDETASAATARRISVPNDGAALDLALTVPRGLYVRGRVETVDVPLFPPGPSLFTTPNVIFFATRANGDGITGQPERDGSFAIGPLTDDEFVITSSGRCAPIEPVRARPNGPPLVLRIVAGGTLRMRAIDTATRASVTCEFALTRTGVLATYGSGGSGPFGVSGIAEGEYGVAVWTEDGRVGVLSSVHIGANAATEGVEIALTPRAECAGIDVSVHETVDVQVWQDSVCRSVTYVRAGYVRRIPAPSGTVEVRFTTDTKVLETRELVLAAGDIAAVRRER